MSGPYCPNCGDFHEKTTAGCPAQPEAARCATCGAAKGTPGWLESCASIGGERFAPQSEARCTTPLARPDTNACARCGEDIATHPQPEARCIPESCAKCGQSHDAEIHQYGMVTDGHVYAPRKPEATGEPLMSREEFARLLREALVSAEADATEIADLRAALKQQTYWHSQAVKMFHAAEAECTALRGEVERLRKKLDGECETCQGTGVMEVVVGFDPTGEGEEKLDVETCGECKGSGKGWMAEAIVKERERVAEAEAALAAKDTEIERLRAGITARADAIFKASEARADDAEQRVRELEAKR